MWRRLASVMFVGLMLLAGGGCVELLGQRLTMHHDEKAEVAQFILTYDGVHDNTDNQQGENAEEALKAFIERGDILLLDWFGRIEMASIRQMAQGQDATAKQRDLAKFVVDHMRTQPIGHYKDSSGFVGGAQLITIEKPQELLKRVNAVINEQLAGQLSGTGRTEKRMRDAARADHQWVALEGQAIRVRVPVDRREWAKAKAEGLAEVVEGLVEEYSEETRTVSRGLIMLLSSAPMSLVDEGDMLTITLGSPRHVNTWRVRIRPDSAYRPNMEAMMKKYVGADLTDALGKLVMAEGEADAKPSVTAGVRAMREWGPAEETVRALIALAESEDEQTAKRGMAALIAFGERWREKEGLPEVPEADDRVAYLGAWRSWLHHMEVFPMGGIALPDPPQEAEEAEMKEEAP